MSRWILAPALLALNAACGGDPGPDTRARETGRLSVLFLGDRGHHQPAQFAQHLLPVMTERGIDLFYTDQLAALSAEKLAGYDAVLIYANHISWTPEQESALFEFVASGKGLVPVHCASYCFLESDAYIDLVGAQFQSHGTGTFSDEIVAPEHPVMKGLESIESWDETYVHHRHNEDREVLAVREHEDGAEPWTWVRTHGQGRVFYTAWGHDQRTWGNAGFRDLLERGIRWSCGDWALDLQPAIEPLTYTEATVPEYLPGEQGTLGEMQAPLTTEESHKRIVVPPGFSVELFAMEPDIRKPIAMAWDERGRLWIAETTDYPNEMRPKGEGNDRLKILEDTDGDGRADRFTIFAEGLSIPTSLCFANGGVIVTQPPDTLFLRDNDGDDRADTREVLFTGWGTRDTHASASNLRYGLDNWIWGTVGYSGFNGEVGGVEHRFSQALYRFRPDGSELEVMGPTTNNTWGLGFSEEGLVFGSTANGNPSVFLGVPNRYYEAVQGFSPSALRTIAETTLIHPVTTKVRQVDYHGRFTAAAGHALYTARSFPQQYWNRAAFVSEPTGHVVHQFFLEPQGAHFVSRDGWNLVASNDEWTAPISAEVGPDGAVWFLDWYNYIVQHNPTPRGFEAGQGAAYVTPLRDKVRGRIYRVVYEAGTPSAEIDFSSATDEQLVAALAHDNQLSRLHAQRLLVEHRSLASLPALIELVGNTDVDPVGLNVGAIHALWTLDGLGVLIGSRGAATTAALAALTHPSAGVRRTALAVLPRSEDVMEAVLGRRLLHDDNAQVRLAALLALAEMPPSATAGREVFEMLREPRNFQDRWIPDAATSAGARHDADFLRAALSTESPEGRERPEPPNLIQNTGAEQLQGTGPVGWQVRTYSGSGADHDLSSNSHSGSMALRISAESFTDTSWRTVVRVERDATYRLSGWIKTEGVEARGGSDAGAQFNIDELQSPRVRTEPLQGTNDWTRVEVVFETGRRRRLSINCLFGGWGQARGTAWFDDVELVRIDDTLLPGPLGAVVSRVTRHYAARVPTESVVSTVLALRGAHEPLAVAFLEGLIVGWPAGMAPALEDVDRAGLAVLLDELPAEARAQLIALADRWDVRDAFAADIEAVLQDLRTAVADAGASVDERAAAAARLVTLEDSPATVDEILSQISPRTPPELAEALLEAASSSRADYAGSRILSRWAEFSPAAQQAAVRALSRRATWTRALLSAVDNQAIPVSAVSAQRWLQFEMHPQPDIALMARELQDARSGDRQEVVEAMIAAATMGGSAQRGAGLFASFCAACHSIGGSGGRIGPPLDGIGARPRQDLLVDLLNPNSSVEDTYRLWVVQRSNGEVYSGRLDVETRTTIQLLDLAGQTHVIPREEIQSLESSSVSLMPATFEGLGVQGLADMLEYLVQGGDR